MIKQRAWKQVSELLEVTGEPELMELFRWDGKMPQYHLGHVELVDQIQKLSDSHPALQLAGNAYRGVGIPACVESGETAARRIINSL